MLLNRRGIGSLLAVSSLLILLGALGFPCLGQSGLQRTAAQGAPPALTLSPTSLSFTGQQVGTTSSAQTTVVTNTGKAQVTNIVVSVTGDFSEADNCPRKMASGSSCTINVNFAPTTSGPRTGAVTVTYNTGTQTLSLSGIGDALSLMTIELSPGDPVIQTGATQQFTATGIYTDRSMRDLTTSVKWSSSDASVAAINASGLAVSQKQGQTTITATSGSVTNSTLLKAVTPGEGFIPTGSLNTARYNHTATLLNDGRVLVAGGADYNGSPLASAELYDPATGTFAPTGNLNTGRANHTATLLNNGKVLIAGGFDGTYTGSALASAELYDPATGNFTLTGSLMTARFHHTATLLNSGKVLIAGASVASAELYDPISGTFVSTGNLINTEGSEFKSILLSDGRVLIASSRPELYDPATGIFTRAVTLNAPTRTEHTATLLNNGTVLFAGGEGFDPTFTVFGPFVSAELYNPTTATSTFTGSLNTARYDHTATLLNNGEVLIAAGLGSNNQSTGLLDSAERYAPQTGTFTLTGSLNRARHFHTATLLSTGRVLITGGYDGWTVLNSAEIY